MSRRTTFSILPTGTAAAMDGAAYPGAHGCAAPGSDAGADAGAGAGADAEAGVDQAAGAGCGACLQRTRAAPMCQHRQALPCAATELVGPQDELRRLLVALGQRLGFAPEAPEQAGVLALRLSPGEVELRLALPARCSGEGAAQAEAAFQALRGLLPDTDIYVTQAA